MARTQQTARGTTRAHRVRGRGRRQGQGQSSIVPLAKGAGGGNIYGSDGNELASVEKYVTSIMAAVLRVLLCRRRYRPTAVLEYLKYGCHRGTHPGRDFGYTPIFAAIMHKVSSVQDDKIWQYKEAILEWHAEAIVESVYEVIQSDIIEVQPHVFVQIVNSREAVARQRENGTVDIEVKLLRLSSDKHTVGELRRIVQGWFKEYEGHRDEQQRSNQMIFMVRFDTDANETLFHRSFETNRAFSNLFFINKAEVLEEIDFFLNNKEWYDERGLPYSLGILLHGPPGCGKTSFIKALLAYTNRHGIVLTVNNFTNMNVIERMMQLDSLCDFPIQQSKRVYILEDIDAMGDLVAKRQPWPDKEKDKTSKEGDPFDPAAMKALSSKMAHFGDDRMTNNMITQIGHSLQRNADNSLARLLQILDGVVETPGRIIIMTTNHVEKLDPALIRPGRIDVQLEFTMCTPLVSREMVSHFFEIPMEATERLNGMKGFSLSPAELVQYCREYKTDLEGLMDKLLALS